MPKLSSIAPASRSASCFSSPKKHSVVPVREFVNRCRRNPVGREVDVADLTDSGFVVGELRVEVRRADRARVWRRVTVNTSPFTHLASTSCRMRSTSFSLGPPVPSVIEHHQQLHDFTVDLATKLTS